jgi:hypothetical protein
VHVPVPRRGLCDLDVLCVWELAEEEEALSLLLGTSVWGRGQSGQPSIELRPLTFDLKVQVPSLVQFYSAQRHPFHLREISDVSRLANIVPDHAQLLFNVVLRRISVLNPMRFVQIAVVY